jgi:hypothetical protein
VLLFTGHRVDPPGRQTPRFPARHEPAARAAIRSAVEDALGAAPEGLVAIAGGASGGDLLFLETCEELGVERHLYLIVPRDDYVRESVAPSGGDWVQRFNHQFETAACRVYQPSMALPGWLQDKPQYSIWERSNLWMLHNALWLGGAQTTVVALWDGEEGDGPGGTKHMVDAARSRGAQVVVLETRALFGLERAP